MANIRVRTDNWRKWDDGQTLFYVLPGMTGEVILMKREVSKYAKDRHGMPATHGVCTVVWDVAMANQSEGDSGNAVFEVWEDDVNPIELKFIGVKFIDVTSDEPEFLPREARPDIMKDGL